MGAKERKDAANEVKVLSSLKHPYIVAYKDSFIEDGFLNIVMEYADGGDLFTRIQKAKKSMTKFPEQQILRWFTQALLALKFIHDKHILHRDLKSQNFFLMSNGKLKIGDFGIAKVLDNTAACAQTTIGTPYYLSPEICQERPAAAEILQRPIVQSEIRRMLLEEQAVKEKAGGADKAGESAELASVAAPASGGMDIENTPPESAMNGAPANVERR